MNNTNPLISIIINCYNGEAYLKKCIESVLVQSYQNWEIIFWDNQSTDQSQKIIKSFKDKRINYFKSANFNSLYAARNLAMKKTSGELICFLDVDDWWSSNKLNTQVNFFNNNNDINFLYCNFYNYYEKNRTQRIFEKKILPFGKITQEILNDYKIGILTVMIKKSILNEINFNENYEIIADFDLFIKLSIKYNIAAIQEPLCYYRIHDLNLSKKKLDQGINEIESWYSQNINSKNFEKYSLKGVKTSIQVLKIKQFFLTGRKYLAIKEILKGPLKLKKIKFTIFLIFPLKIIRLFLEQ